MHAKTGYRGREHNRCTDGLLLPINKRRQTNAFAAALALTRVKTMAVMSDGADTVWLSFDLAHTSARSVLFTCLFLLFDASSLHIVLLFNTPLLHTPFAFRMARWHLKSLSYTWRFMCHFFSYHHVLFKTKQYTIYVSPQVTSEIYNFTTQDVEAVKRSAYRARRKVLPPLPKCVGDIAQAYMTAWKHPIAYNEREWFSTN